MKKFYITLCVIIVSISCTNDTQNQPDPHLLQRVDFYPGTSFETRWLFNENGLLKQITKADGTVIQDFIYDAQERLSSSTIYEASANQTYNFTYDSNGFVTTVNNQSLQYNTAGGFYYFGDLNGYFSKFKIDSEKLLTSSKTAYIDEVELGQFEESIVYQIDIYYLNNNITAYNIGESCDNSTYDNNINPLRNATLAICRAFSFVPKSLWPYHHCISANNILTEKYCSEDPESEVYHYTYNTINLPKEQTRDNYYLGTYENTLFSAKYYYQGELLP